MNRWLAGVLVCTSAALAVGTVRVPTRWFDRRLNSGTVVTQANVGAPPVIRKREAWTSWAPSPSLDALTPRWTWMWNLQSVSSPGGNGLPHAEQRVDWRLLIPTQLTVLLLGGGLLAWVVRRERRRKSTVT